MDEQRIADKYNLKWYSAQKMIFEQNYPFLVQILT